MEALYPLLYISVGVFSLGFGGLFIQRWLWPRIQDWMHTPLTAEQMETLRAEKQEQRRKLHENDPAYVKMVIDPTETPLPDMNV